jgi:hypothetical protein
MRSWRIGCGRRRRGCCPATARTTLHDNIDNDRMIIPTEGNHVISVSALGSTGRKAGLLH